MHLTRRKLLGTILLLPAGVAVANDKEATATQLRGKLEAQSDEISGLRLTDGAFIRLTGDEQTTKVLHDKRLQGLDFEVLGERKQNGEFSVLPIHLAALFTYQDGKRLRVTYYCDVCAIRTYSPGLCMCCRENTRVDLVDPAEITKS